MPRLYVSVCLFVVCFIHLAAAQQNRNEELIKKNLAQHEYELSSDGKNFLSNAARNASFFLLGELHGENEIPELLHQLWPVMWRDGYRYIAGELSPWAANRMEFATPDQQPKLMTLWTQPEVSFVHSFGGSRPVLWGCDMEEFQTQLLIRDLATANPQNPTLREMQEIVKSGYKRNMAHDLLALSRSLSGIHDPSVNGIPLLKNIQSTLEIDEYRLNPDTKFSAQLRRESLMKELFLEHYQQNIPPQSQEKIMLRFGRNHLHRGYDVRGISTLGNFIAEFAFAQHKTVFNVAAFGAGGKASLAGETWDADERNDDLAFALFASSARYSATVFDLQPLRQLLHRIPAEERSPEQQRLAFWADSYDAIICYKNVTPRN